MSSAKESSNPNETCLPMKARFLSLRCQGAWGNLRGGVLLDLREGSGIKEGGLVISIKLRRRKRELRRGDYLLHLHPDKLSVNLLITLFCGCLGP